jgi:hypothetical protein
MKKYIIEMQADLFSLIIDLDKHLSEIDVKAENVGRMFTARLILKEIVSNIKEEEKKEDKDG